MQPVFLMLGGVMTGLALGRREFVLLLIGVLAIGIGWFNPDAASGLPVPVVVGVAIVVGFILARAFPKRRYRRRWSSGVTTDGYTSSWSDSSSSSSSDGAGGWFGGGESGGGGASGDWSSGDSGGSDSGGGDSGGGDSGGSSSD